MMMWRRGEKVHVLVFLRRGRREKRRETHTHTKERGGEWGGSKRKVEDVCVCVLVASYTHVGKERRK
jgi:hypothetical protein